MKKRDLFLLVLLSAIWGGSFVFMRVLAPQFGAIATACMRLALGGFFLFCVFGILQRIKQKRRNKTNTQGVFVVNWRKNFGKLCILGVLNSALPFSLYAYAALTIPAAYSSVINSCSPLFGALLGSLFLRDKFNLRKLFGFCVGFGGVILLVYKKQTLGSLHFNQSEIFAFASCLCAALCYALGGIFVKTTMQGVSGTEIAIGSSLCAALFLVLLLFLQGFHFISLPGQVNFFQLAESLPKNFHVVTSLLPAILGLGILCSGIAYLIYFKLMQTYGPAKTLTVTYLMPVFGILWGWMFLKEVPTWNIWLGAGCVLCSVWITIEA